MHDTAGKDFISAHTIEANVGIYTQPGTWPSYLALGEFGVGTADPNATRRSAASRRRPRPDLPRVRDDRRHNAGRHLLMDVDPRTGAVKNRWITPLEMTGENQTGNPTGGITTQLRAPSRSAPACGRRRRPSACSASRRA